MVFSLSVLIIYVFHALKIKKALSKKRRKHEELNSSVTDAPEMKFRCFGNSETQRKLEFSSFHHGEFRDAETWIFVPGKLKI